MEGRRAVWSGSGSGGNVFRGPISAERVRLQALAKEFASLLAEAVKSASTPTTGQAAQGNSIPEPKHFWLVPVLHRLADIAERLEASYCRQPGVNVFENRRYMYPIGQAIRLATMGTLDDDRYSQPTRFVTSVLFGLLRSGGGVGGGAIVLAAVCRFLCAVSMATVDQGSRTVPPPPIPSLLSEELEIYEQVLSWARGGAPPASGGGGSFDAAAAQAAMEKGRELVRSNMRAANPEEGSKSGGGEKGKGKAKVPKTVAAEQASRGPAGGGSASSGGGTEVSEVEGAGAGSGVEPGTTALVDSPQATVAAAATMPPTAAEVLADRASAEAELRAHATGLLAAGLLSRELSDLIVNKGFAAHLVQRLREGPVADHLRAEAAKEYHRKASSGDGLARDGGNSAGGNSGDPSVAVGAAAGSAAAAGGGDGAAAAAAAAAAASVGAAVASAPQQPAPTYGRWANVAAVEAEHVAACMSGIGGYQEILTPLFSGDGLAVVDLLLANPQLEIRGHAVELLSTLLVHKKVGLAFVRRGWVRTLLRLGALEDGTAFLEPEVGYCLHVLASSGGVMEAVCRAQDDTLERLLAYAATLLRSPSESTQKNALLFWEAAMRFPPALEAFDKYGGVSKLVYLLLPTGQSYSDGSAASGTGAGGRGRTAAAAAAAAATGTESAGASARNDGESSSPPRQQMRWRRSSLDALNGGTGLAGGQGQGGGSSATPHRRTHVTLGACGCVRQYLRCSLALAVLKQRGGSAAAGGHVSRHHHQQQQQRARRGSDSLSETAVAAAAAAAGVTPPSPSLSRAPGRPAWQCKPLAVDDASHAANVAAVKGQGGLGGGGEGRAAAGVRDREAVTVRLGMHWSPAVQLMHHRGMQALINVVDAMLSQRTGAETVVYALDALGTAALCPLVYAEFCRAGPNSPAGGGGGDARGTGGGERSSSTPARDGGDGEGARSQPPPPPQPGGGRASSGGGGRRGAGGRSGRRGGGGRSGEGDEGGGGGSSGGGALPRNRLGVDVLLDAAAGVRQKDPGVMCAALNVLDRCCRPHKGCGPLIQPGTATSSFAATAGGDSTATQPGGATAASSSRSGDSSSRPLHDGGGGGGSNRSGPAAAAGGRGGTADGRGGVVGAEVKRPSASGDPTAAAGYRDNLRLASGGRSTPKGGGGGGGVTFAAGSRRDGSVSAQGSGDRVVDDRLQRPMRKLIRESNGLRVLVGLLRYRRQVVAADAVRLRAALCLLGLAHDVHIAQMLEKMRITTTLSDTVRAGPVVGRNVETYSQLREAAKQIIARVAGRLSGTVGKSGLMDPAVTGLERAAVVANTPITFRPRELLGIIHEYLAANGLAGAAEALASEAGITPGMTAAAGGGGGGAGESPLPDHAAAADRWRSGGTSAPPAAESAAKLLPPPLLSPVSYSAGPEVDRRRAGGRSGGSRDGNPEGDKRGGARGVKRLSFSTAAVAGGKGKGVAAGSGGTGGGGGGGKKRGEAKAGTASSLKRSTSRSRSSAAGYPEGEGAGAAKRARLVNPDAGPSTEVGDSSHADHCDKPKSKQVKEEHDSAELRDISSSGRPAPRARARSPAIPAMTPMGRAGRIAAAFASPSYFGDCGAGRRSGDPAAASGHRRRSPLRVVPPRAGATPGNTSSRGEGGGGSGGRRARAKPEWSSSTPSRPSTACSSPLSSGGCSSSSASVAAGGGKRSTRTATATAVSLVHAAAAVAAGSGGGACVGGVTEGRGAMTTPCVAGGEREDSSWAAAPPVGTPRGFYNNGDPSVSPWTAAAAAAAATTPFEEGACRGGGKGAGSLESRCGGGGGQRGRARGRGTVAVGGGGGGGGTRREGGDGAAAAVAGTTALDKIVTSFLRNQHERCSDPICVLPPLSLSEPHQCPGRTPVGAMGSGAPPNVAKRALAWQAVPPLGGRGGARLQKEFVYSRFRRIRSIQDPEDVITASSFARRPGGGASRLWVGTHVGVVKLWETFSMSVEGRWRVSQHPVTSIEQHPGASRVGRSLPAGSGMSPLLLTSVGSGFDSEALLWKALDRTDVNPEDADQQEEQPLFRWQGLRAARFDHGGTRAAAVVYPQIGGLDEDQRYNQTWGAQVLDVETGSVLARLWDARSRPLYPLPNVGFNATDDLVVTDGALWDPRRGLRVYQFDKLGGGGGFGLFHPNGNEVVLDEGVWDLRTHRLLRTLPCQDGTVMKQDPGGDVLYTYRPAPAGDFFDLPQKRAAQDTCFGVLDSSTYDQIHSHDTEKAVIQLSTDDGGGDGSCISVVERADPLLNTVDTVCSLYEIGRKRPDEADSDLDDAMSEDSDEEWEDADHSDGGDDLLEDRRSRWTARGGSSGDSDDILVDGGSSGSDSGSDDGAGTSSGSESDIFQSLLRRRGGGAVYDAASASGSSSTDDWLARRRVNRRRIARRRGEVSSTDDSNEEDDSDEEEEDDDDEEETEN